MSKLGWDDDEWAWWFELDPMERRELRTDFADDHYIRYRLRGLDRHEAFAAVIAWQNNMAEQHARRLSHDTGAT